MSENKGAGRGEFVNYFDSREARRVSWFRSFSSWPAKISPWVIAFWEYIWPFMTDASYALIRSLLKLLRAVIMLFSRVSIRELVFDTSTPRELTVVLRELTVVVRFFISVLSSLRKSARSPLVAGWLLFVSVIYQFYNMAS